MALFGILQSFKHPARGAYPAPYIFVDAKTQRFLSFFLFFSQFFLL